jgi:hypothetical protein
MIALITQLFCANMSNIVRILIHNSNYNHVIFNRDLVSKNNVNTVNSNIYFCIRNAASSPSVFGLANLGGACTSNLEEKSAIQEWDNNDIVTAQVINKILTKVCSNLT